MKKTLAIVPLLALTAVRAQSQQPTTWEATANPIIQHKYTADPAPVVHGDTLYLYTGIDEKGGQTGYVMREWALFTTTDLLHWTEHASPLNVAEFKWASSKQAYACHVTERGGKWYFYVSTNWCGIGVAVGDSPYGPFRDALGHPMLTNKDCPGTDHSWACIDPAVFVDDDGQAWMAWGNRRCFLAKLKDNMVELDGPVMDITPEGSDFTEAPWIHKRGGLYYLTFAMGWPERLGYATSKSMEGPWEFGGLLSEVSGNSNTTHPGIVRFGGRDILFTHNGTLHDGTSYSRSVCMQPLRYGKKGALEKCDVTTDGPQLLQK